MTNDLISRQAAIDALIERDPNCGIDGAEVIKGLPSAQRWIPCSERLPENEDYDETFTVTIQCEHVDGWDDYVTGYADWTPHGWDIQSYYLGQIKVTAWMPLPKPWKGDAS